MKGPTISVLVGDLGVLPADRVSVKLRVTVNY